MPRRLSEIAASAGGELRGEDVLVSSVAVDSRAVAEGGLFFALPGENADGHSFIEDAMSRGAVAACVTRPETFGGPAIVVADAVQALGAVATAERAASSAKVIGITGSTGKTTTKDLATAVLGTRFEVQASPGSYNNEVGLPLTILGEETSTEVIVCEMGARGIGHIAELCRIAAPELGVVTNVGIAHLELFGSIDNIARAKRELVESLPTDGVAVLNADDVAVREMANHTQARPLTFGLSASADVRAEGVELSDAGFARFTLVASGQRVQAELAVPGEHMVSNALAAVAVGVALGVPPEDAAESLRAATASSWRMETFTNRDGIVVINDAYNANPQSMAAALRTARWVAKDSRMVAVLGRMAELGEATLDEHERVGELAARLRVERLLTVGPEARSIAVAAVREGVEPENVASFDDARDALEDVLVWARPGDVVLFKASRVVGLERLAEAMR